MNRRNINLFRGIFATCIAVLFITSMVFAAANDTSIEWYSIDTGGGTSSSNNFTLSGTIGQAEAGPSMSGESYTLSGGFWGSKLIEFISNFVYFPLVIR